MAVMAACYLCGRPASRPLSLKDSFTAHPLCRVPWSDSMCDRCDRTINGDWQIVWYFNSEKEIPKSGGQKGVWSKSFTRNFSWLFQGETLVYPQIGEPEEHVAIGADGKPKKPETLPVAHKLLTRSLLREILLNPPQPPFTLAIAESGQKHILPWAAEALDRERFPVQFEMDSIFVDRARFAGLLGHYESLMALGFSKGEIQSGDYLSNRLQAAIATNSEEYWQAETAIAACRDTRLLELVGFVATRPEIPVATTNSTAIKQEPRQPNTPTQLSLF